MAATGMAPEELGDICLTLHPEPVKQSHPQYLKPGSVEDSTYPDTA